MRSSTPPGPVTVPPPGPTATLPSGATNWLRVKVVTLPWGSVIVTSRTSLIVAGITPFNEPSLRTVNELTTPLVASMIKTVLPGGSEPGGADTVTLPLASGKEKVILLVSYTGGVLDAVVNVTLGTEIEPPKTSANPEACNVYWVEGCNAACGITARLLPLTESTKRTGTTWLLATAPWKSFTLSVVTDAAVAPSAGVTVAVVVAPVSAMFRFAVWPAVTRAEEEPCKDVSGTWA